MTRTADSQENQTAVETAENCRHCRRRRRRLSQQQIQQIRKHATGTDKTTQTLSNKYVSITYEYIHLCFHLFPRSQNFDALVCPAPPDAISPTAKQALQACCPLIEIAFDPPLGTSFVRRPSIRHWAAAPATAGDRRENSASRLRAIDCAEPTSDPKEKSNRIEVSKGTLFFTLRRSLKSCVSVASETRDTQSFIFRDNPL